MSQAIANELLKKIDRARIPAHVAIIMDGNGRWAKQRHLPRLWGHRVGSTSVRDVVEAAGQIGIRVLTLYAFSTENWARPTTEVSGLMKLLKATLKREQPQLEKNDVRLDTIGDISALPKDVQDQIEKTRKFLSKNKGLTLVLALNYGGRQDIVHACNKLIAQKQIAVTEEMISEQLYTSKWPDPDLLIRSSGESRISNFLLWQIAYSEIHIAPVLWPEFRREHLYQALVDFQSRHRRFGGLN